MRIFRLVPLLLLVLGVSDGGFAESRSAETKSAKPMQGISDGTVSDRRVIMLPTERFQDPVRLYSMVASSSLIFLGEIVNVRLDKSKNIRLVKFRTKKVWRGAQKKYITLSAGAPRPWCQNAISEGSRYTVYAGGSPLTLKCEQLIGGDVFFEHQEIFKRIDIATQAQVEVIGPGTAVTAQNIESIKAQIKEREAQIRSARDVEK